MDFLKKIINVISGTGQKEEVFLEPAVTPSDEKLVELFVDGKDEAAFEEIVNRYVDKVYGLAFRITRDHNGAEEVVQEVFLILINKLGTFRGEAKFSSWLYKVTANASYMYLRANRKYKSDSSLDGYAPYDERGTLMGRVKVKDWSNTPDEVLLSREAMDMVEKAVEELPEPYRIVFHLKDVDGLTNEEVASVLGLSVPAVKSRLHRARLFLRDKLSDYFYEWKRRG
ncbi:MAG TPA: sigma-70 family RNA polymerase sigma factor [Thermodesulfobacteriota bacterium]|nr:sigma-70 family RNA polymerase sigma factor [Thermodesulfobacteriota bacterium]